MMQKRGNTTAKNVASVEKEAGRISFTANLVEFALPLISRTLTNAEKKVGKTNVLSALKAFIQQHNNHWHQGVVILFIRTVIG